MARTIGKTYPTYTIDGKGYTGSLKDAIRAASLASEVNGTSVLLCIPSSGTGALKVTYVDGKCVKREGIVY